MRRIRTIILPLVTLALLAPASAFAGLIFSEYVEGTSNNKAVEIYNPTGAPVNLSGYSIRTYSNGSASISSTILLAAVSVPSGGTYVVANSAATAAILAVANQTSGSLSFNGDDALALFDGASEIDIIGQIGFDPGAEWGTGLQSTADNTIRRNADVCTGDTNGGNVFDPSVEWTGFATDTFGGLGSHASTCVAVPGAPAWVTGALALLLLAGGMIVMRRRAGQATA